MKKEIVNRIYESLYLLFSGITNWIIHRDLILHPQNNQLEDYVFRMVMVQVHCGILGIICLESIRNRMKQLLQLYHPQIQLEFQYFMYALILLWIPMHWVIYSCEFKGPKFYSETDNPLNPCFLIPFLEFLWGFLMALTFYLHIIIIAILMSVLIKTRSVLTLR